MSKGQFDEYDTPSQRFSLDNDYDGGEFGEDGEFYALGQKVRRSFRFPLSQCMWFATRHLELYLRSHAYRKHVTILQFVVILILHDAPILLFGACSF
jgi:hypothetical protein